MVERGEIQQFVQGEKDPQKVITTVKFFVPSQCPWKDCGKSQKLQKCTKISSCGGDTR